MHFPDFSRMKFCLKSQCLVRVPRAYFLTHSWSLPPLRSNCRQGCVCLQLLSMGLQGKEITWLLPQERKCSPRPPLALTALADVVEHRSCPELCSVIQTKGWEMSVETQTVSDTALVMIVLPGISCMSNYYSPNSIIHSCDRWFHLYFSLTHKPLISIPCSESIPHPAAKTSQEHKITVSLVPFCGSHLPSLLWGQKWCHWRVVQGHGAAVGHVSLPREPAAPFHLSLLPAPHHTKPFDSECLICFQKKKRKTST